MMKRDLLLAATLVVSMSLAGSAAGQYKSQEQLAQEAARARKAEEAKEAEQRQAEAKKAERAEQAQQKQKQQQQRIRRETQRKNEEAAAAAKAAADAQAAEAKAAETKAAEAAAAAKAAADVQAAADAKANADAAAAAAVTLPAGLRGFDGTLSGTVVRADKDGEHLVLRPNRVLHTSPRSTAATPEAALTNNVEVTIYPGLESHGDPEQQRQWIRSLHANRVGSDKVPVDVKEVDGKLRINSLTPEAQQEAQTFAGAAQNATLPESLKGFDGTLSGTVVSADKAGEYFVLRPKQVLHTSPRSTAAKPEGVAGTDVTIYPGDNPHGDPELQRQWIRSLHANRVGDDKVPVDVKEVDGKLRINALTPEAQQAAAQLAPEQPQKKEPAN